MNRASDPALVLFDIDGTLVDFRGDGARAMTIAGQELFGDTFSVEGIPMAGSLDSVIFRRIVERHGLDYDRDHPRFRHAYGEQLQAMVDRGETANEALPGIGTLVAQLHDRDDVTLGLLTGNYAHTGPMKLRACGINPDLFPITAFGDQAEARPDLTELAMSRYEERRGGPIDPERVVVIGDTPHDVNCAKVHGCVAFAVATGHYGVEELEACGADVAVEDLADPTPLLDLLGA